MKDSKNLILAEICLVHNTAVMVFRYIAYHGANAAHSTYRIAILSYSLRSANPCRRDLCINGCSNRHALAKKRLIKRRPKFFGRIDRVSEKFQLSLFIGCKVLAHLVQSIGLRINRVVLLHTRKLVLLICQLLH